MQSCRRYQRLANGCYHFNCAGSEISISTGYFEFLRTQVRVLSRPITFMTNIDPSIDTGNSHCGNPSSEHLVRLPVVYYMITGIGWVCCEFRQMQTSGRSTAISWPSLPTYIHKMYHYSCDQYTQRLVSSANLFLHRPFPFLPN